MAACWRPSPALCLMGKKNAVAGIQMPRLCIKRPLTNVNWAVSDMKALVKKHAEEGLWLEDVPIPLVGGNDVLIKVHKTAICGTDVHIYNWDEWAQKTIPVPMTAGHEYAGEIVELGANVTGLQVGDIVSGEGHIV